MKDLKRKAKKAVDTIVSHETCPLDIFAMRLRANEAKEFLDELPDPLKTECFDKIQERIDIYYTPDEYGISHHDWDMRIMYNS